MYWIALKILTGQRRGQREAPKRGTERHQIPASFGSLPVSFSIS
jgi:hypothetical protein